MGEGSFDRTPVERRGPIVEACRNVRRWAFALMNEPATLEEFRGIKVPVLYMVGGRSPGSSRSVAERLVAVLPAVRRVECPELGHMGPVTDPQAVNAIFATILKAGESGK
jgi:pimeloyl-ACP methyl ester carboxylesterase